MLATSKHDVTCSVTNSINNTQRNQQLITIGQGIIIVGGSGAGKTTLAKHLAHILGLPFIDSDNLIEKKNNNNIANIFAYHGETGFRFIEEKVIYDCIKSPSIISLGAGAWENANTRQAVRRSEFATLWLDESPVIAWNRVVGDQSRPLVTTYNQFLTRWIKRIPAWSSETKIIPSKASSHTLAKILTKLI
jgi:shikimate kinase